MLSIKGKTSQMDRCSRKGKDLRRTVPCDENSSAESMTMVIWQDS